MEEQQMKQSAWWGPLVFLGSVIAVIAIMFAIHNHDAEVNRRLAPPPVYEHVETALERCVRQTRAKMPEVADPARMCAAAADLQAFCAMNNC
jgi:hypothetical protein